MSYGWTCCLACSPSWCPPMPRRLRSPVGVAVLAVCLGVATPAPGAAQAGPDTVAVLQPPGPGPAGAFLRGVLIPGWGHTVSGSLTRGAFYFGVETASIWMLFKTVKKLDAVRSRVDFWETRVTERLMSEGIVDPVEIATALDADPDVVRTRNLAEGREEQREDWMAVTIFFLLVSGVDAFVSAHLQGFPEPLTVGATHDGEGLQVGFRIPVGFPGSR